MLAKFHCARACPPGAARRSTASGKGALPNETRERVSEGSRNRSSTLPQRHNTPCALSSFATSASAAVCLGRMSAGRFTSAEISQFRRFTTKGKLQQTSRAYAGEFRVARSSRVLVLASRQNGLYSMRVAVKNIALRVTRVQGSPRKRDAFANTRDRGGGRD